MEQKQYEVLRGFMNHLTKDYNWYYDTPEQRFKHTPKSIWLINPETKEWILELKKNGGLLWYWNFYKNFQRYFNMKRPDFERFIKLWVEDVLNRRVFSTENRSRRAAYHMEDVLNRGKYIKDCMGVDGGIKNHYLYLLEKSFYDDFQNKVDERVIEHIFNTTEK